MEKDPYAGLSESARKTAINRMRRTLTQKPRYRKTREYVKSLTGAIELPEYAPAPVKEAEPKPTIGQIFTRPLRVRKDRVSPHACKRSGFVVVPPTPKKAKPLRRPTNCRPHHRFRRDVTGSQREPRDMETVYSQRERLAVAQSGLCGICGEALPEKAHEGSLDHVIPCALGGKDVLGNLVVVHKLCNAEKSNDVPTGCEMVFLLMVNAKIGAKPVVF